MKQSNHWPWVALNTWKSTCRTETSVFRVSSPTLRGTQQSFQIKIPFSAQSAQDNQRNIVDIGSPDDRILNCCLQCQSLESKHIVLLSNDINLRNKALCSKVTAFSMAQLAEELNIK